MNAFGKLVFSTVAAGAIGVITAAIYKHGRKQGREDVVEIIKPERLRVRMAEVLRNALGKYEAD